MCICVHVPYTPIDIRACVCVCPSTCGCVHLDVGRVYMPFAYARELCPYVCVCVCVCASTCGDVHLDVGRVYMPFAYARELCPYVCVCVCVCVCVLLGCEG